MRTVQIGKVTLGEGRPKICVPLTAGTPEELKREAAEAAACPAAEIVEWRADWYREIEKPGAVQSAMEQLRGVLGDIPVLFTFRSREEGGAAALSTEQYSSLVTEAIACGADAADIELSRGDGTVRKLAEKIKKAGSCSIVSSHDFEKTPSVGEMIARLTAMQRLGADVCKLAVMPRCEADVLALLEAACRLKQERPDMLLITMSMSSLGVISRVCGETFGSVLTFGTVGKASAPGQLDAVCLKQILEALSRTESRL